MKKINKMIVTLVLPGILVCISGYVMFQYRILSAQLWMSYGATVEDAKKDLEEHPDMVDMMDDNGQTGLMMAVMRDDIAMARMLLAHGASPNLYSKNHDKTTALHLAIDIGNNVRGTEMIELLLKYGAQVNIRNGEGDTPVHLLDRVSIIDRRKQITDLLLQYNGDPNLSDAQGNGLLHRAIFPLNDVEYVQYLVEKYPSRINFGMRNTRGETPADRAIDFMKQYMTQVLNTQIGRIIGANGKIGEVDDQGRTGLMLAIMRYDLPGARLLLQNGEDVNARDKSGYTALIYGLSGVRDQAESTKLLLDSGANPNIADAFGNTALHHALFMHEMPVYYCGYRRDYTTGYMTASDTYGYAASYACGLATHYTKDPFLRNNVIRMLLDKGVSVTQTNSAGDTPLHLAVSLDDEQLIELLKNSINVNIKNSAGLTPLELAKQRNLDRIANMLATHGY